MKARTDTFQFTVKSLNAAKLKKLRKTIAEFNSLAIIQYHNSLGKTKAIQLKYRVSIKARLGTNNPHAKLYGKGNGKRDRQYIKLEHGQRFDVYIHTR